MSYIYDISRLRVNITLLPWGLHPSGVPTKTLYDVIIIRRYYKDSILLGYYALSPVVINSRKYSSYHFHLQVHVAAFVNCLALKLTF